MIYSSRDMITTHHHNHHQYHHRYPQEKKLTIIIIMILMTGREDIWKKERTPYFYSQKKSCLWWLNTFFWQKFKLKSGHFFSFSCHLISFSIESKVSLKNGIFEWSDHSPNASQKIIRSDPSSNGPETRSKRFPFESRSATSFGGTVRWDYIMTSHHQHYLLWYSLTTSSLIT